MTNNIQLDRGSRLPDEKPQPGEAGAAAPILPDGLTSAEAARRRAEFGPNSVQDEPEHVIRRIARHAWSPVPWMLEATIVLQLIVGERLEAAMIAVLLLLNIGLGVVQEGRASATLALLRKSLTPRVRVRRDGAWVQGESAGLVPGDLVQLSLGGIVPADLRLVSGNVSLDQSMLTGESLAVEVTPEMAAYAGALIRRGEAIGEVIATGPRTYFGRTAELVRTAHVESSEQRAVLAVVRALSGVNFVLVIAMLGYAHTIGLPTREIIPLMLTAMLSAVPVALPATFTVAAATGARTLARQGVLLTRLSALHEAAMIDVLCADKTGTLTENALSLTAIWSQPGIADADVLCHAAAASSPDGQDPLDAAVRAAATRAAAPPLRVTRFVPFDPAAKLAEATVRATENRDIRVVKGSPLSIGAIAPLTGAAESALRDFTNEGRRVLAVAAGEPGAMRLLGLIAFSDPPRADSAPLLRELRDLGVAPVMVTGDTPATARTVAKAIGLEGPICPPQQIPDGVGPTDFAVFAGVFPEDKFRLVRALQRNGHIVGMCGDGANDAPALRQAQTGIAVATATDVAKSAAGVVLTQPGLSGIVACIREGRSAFQRVLTYTLSLLVNKCVTLIVLGVGLVFTGHAVLTPLLQGIWMLTGDFVMMARAGDRASPTQYPNAWRVRALTLAAVPLGVTKLAYSVAMLALARYWLQLSIPQMQTFTFLTLVLAGTMTSYVLRERRHFWSTRPARIMLVASAANAALVIALAFRGWLMTPLSGLTVILVVLGTGLFAVALDNVKLVTLALVNIDCAVRARPRGHGSGAVGRSERKPKAVA